MGLPGEEVAMVVKVLAISRQTSADIAQKFRDRAAQVRARAAEMMAEDIVKASPVDTGTYIMSHIATTGDAPAGGTTSSMGKPTGRSKAQFENLALGNLKRSVSKDAILNSAQVFFFNRAEHAPEVEFIGWKSVQAYHVYAQARAMALQRIRDAAKEFGMETR